MCGEKGEKQMLNDKICKLREKLNESIINGEDYSIIYQLSRTILRNIDKK